MDLQLANRVVVVSGGASGIGAAIVRALVAEGAVPVIVDRDRGAAEGLAEALRGAGRAVDVIAVDLTDPAAPRAAVGETLARHGRLDGLVNNAGVNDGAGLADGVEAFQRSLTANLVHAFALAHHGRAALIAARGAIVNVASKVALTGQGGTSGYAASKGALLALTREWAAELSRDGVRVNAVVPAEVATPLYERWLQTFDDPVAARAAIERRVPLGGRMTTPDEIAAQVLFLLSPVSAHTTGQWVVVDGGYTHLDRALGDRP